MTRLAGHREIGRVDLPRSAIALGIRDFVGRLFRDNRQSRADQTLGAAQQFPGAFDRVLAALDELILEGFACPGQRSSGLAHSALPYSDGSAFVVSQPLMVSSGGYQRSGLSRAHSISVKSPIVGNARLDWFRIAANCWARALDCSTYAQASSRMRLFSARRALARSMTREFASKTSMATTNADRE